MIKSRVKENNKFKNITIINTTEIHQSGVDKKKETKAGISETGTDRGGDGGRGNKNGGSKSGKEAGYGKEETGSLKSLLGNGLSERQGSQSGTDGKKAEKDSNGSDRNGAVTESSNGNGIIDDSEGKKAKGSNGGGSGTENQTSQKTNGNELLSSHLRCYVFRVLVTVFTS